MPRAPRREAWASHRPCPTLCRRTTENLVESSPQYLFIRPRLTVPTYSLCCVYFCGAALLYIHRCFFAHAISSHPHDPIKSQYAPSFLAGYRSACTIIASVGQQFALFPAQIARFWVLWTHAFSAAVRFYPSFVGHSSVVLIMYCIR